MKTESGVHISRALDDLIGSLGIKGKISEYDAVLMWGEVVGDQIVKAATAESISKGVLSVRVKTGVWRNELMLRKAEIIKKLNFALGTKIVRDIKFR
jgi:predicted nucleic acid-binding Zn ribbon protein